MLSVGVQHIIPHSHALLKSSELFLLQFVFQLFITIFLNVLWLY